jgi:hypothetical protein
MTEVGVKKQPAVQEANGSLLPDLRDGAADELTAGCISGSNILIHVRFRPDGEIWQITQCPETLTPGEWFKKLCARVGDKFQTRSGGRGLFRLSAEQLDALRTAQVH